MYEWRTLAILAVLALAPPVAAQAPGPPAPEQVAPDQVIAYLDRNGDGKVDRNEYLHFQASRFVQFDANADGGLSLTEFRESLQGDGRRNARRSFDAFNQRGRTLSREEFLGYHAFVFDRFVDTNRDGVMSADEWTKVVRR